MMNTDYSFTELLAQELSRAQSALLAVLEKYDELRYLKAPKLYDEYAEKIGTYEDEVLRAELEAKLLGRKLELIQAAVNRREPVDMDKIEEQIDRERQQTLGELERGDASGNVISFDRALLSDSDEDELKELYHEIVRQFHPQVNTDMTELQKQLYQKATAAYREKALPLLRLVYDMLTGGRSEGTVSETGGGDDRAAFVADYSLAQQLSPFFSVTGDDNVYIQKTAGCMRQCREKTEETERLLEQFPFTAEETLRDPAKTAAYLEELRGRGYNARRESETLEQRISELTGVRANGEHQ